MERSRSLRPLAPIEPYPSPPRRSAARRRGWIPRVRLPWTVYGYISGEVLRIFLLGILAVSLFYTILAAYQTVRSGLQLGFVWPLLFKTFAYPLYFSIPLAFLFGMTLTIGRMNGDLEVTALRTHGISNIHIYAPIIALGILLGGASHCLNGWVVPRIHYEKKNLQSYILNQLENLGSGINRTILLPDDEGSLYVGAYEGTQLRRVMVELRAKSDSSLLPAIRRHLPEKLPSRVTIFANEGRVEVHPEEKGVILNLRSVQVCVPEAVRGAAPANDFFHQTLTITENVLIPLSFAPKRLGIKDRALPDLLRFIAKLREESRGAEGAGVAFASFNESEGEDPVRQTALRKARSASTELHRRFAFTFSCLSFPLVGVSLSLLLRRWSRLVPFFVGNLVVILLFYPLLMIGTALGEQGVFPAVSMALPNAALLILSAVLIRKAARQ